MTLFGIRNKTTKNPLRISIFSNEGAEDCNSCGSLFDDSVYGESVYTVTRYESAERALQEDPKWYNACLEHPQWPDNFNPDNYEVFEIDIP